MLGGDVVAASTSIGPWSEIRAQLSQHPVKTRLALTGTVVVARDIAHAKIAELLDEPAARCPSTSRPPRVLRRPGQDARGLRLGQLRAHHRRAHGLLRREVPGRRRLAGDAGQGQPLATGHRRVPGPRRLLPRFDRRTAARLAQDCIRKVEVLEYPELGMEAVWRIEVEDFPAFIVVDDKGNDFFAEVTTPVNLGAKG
jgi:fumarate hydratase class I